MPNVSILWILSIILLQISSLNGFVQQFVQQLLFAVLELAWMCTSVRTDVAFLCTSVRTSVDKKATDVRTDVAFFCTYYLLNCNLVCKSQYMVILNLVW